MSYTIRLSDGDIDIDSTGGQTMLSGADKVAQDIADAILHPPDLDRGYGNHLFDSHGQLKKIAGSPLLGKQAVHSYIQQAVTSLMHSQTRQGRVPASERIERISELIVRPGSRVGDFVFFLSVRTADGSTVGQGFEVSLAHLSVPDEYALGGRS